MRRKLLLVHIVALGFLVFTCLLAQRTQAASIAISVGCSVDNAILSTNNNADTGGCIGSGAYGNDTITIPAGTWAKTTNVTSSENLSFVGAGMGVSVVDAGGVAPGLICDNSGPSLIDLNISGLTIQNTASSSGAFPVAGVDCDLSIVDVEITGGQEDMNIYYTINNDAVTARLNVSNVYIHDTLGGGVVMFLEGEGVSNQLSAEIDRLTVARAYNLNKILGSIGVSVGDGNDNTASTHVADVRVRNSTLTGDDVNPSYGVFGSIQSGVSGNNDTIDIVLENNTIVNHTAGGGFPASGILAAASAPPGATANVAITTQNMLVANNLANSALSSCFTAGLGGGGTEIASITSLGHNLSDDVSCGFTSMGDQQNLAGLIGSLGPLQNNGGNVPTMELLDTSPAIDGGATVVGMVSDQRGVARPQCAAYDVGAYEYDGACPIALVNSPSSSSSPSVPIAYLADTGESILYYLIASSIISIAGAGVLFALRRV